MRRFVALTIVGLFLMSMFSGLPVIGSNEIDTEEVPVGWYTTWFRDADRNEVDDHLDGDQQADIFVNYHRPVTTKDTDRLAKFGVVTYVDPYIDVAAVSTVDRKDLSDVAVLPGVVMVEKQLDLVPFLDVSVPAIRGYGSSTYVDGARDLGYNGSGVSVAIFDTGVDNDVHEFLDDLDNNAGTNDPKYLAGVDTTPIVGYIEGDPEDLDGHGTHVAGIAIGTGYQNGTYTGVAPQSRLIDVKVLPTVGYGSAVDFVEGLTWCRNNMDTYNIKVLSMSFGTQGTSDGNDTLSRAVNDAVLRDGLVVIAAIGNDGPSNTGIPAPAAADQAIAIGAYDDLDTVTRADDSLYSSSSRGPRTTDGDDDPLDELKPDVSAPGVDIWSAQANTFGALRMLTGTSMAAPHVAGVVALMLDANPDLGPADVKQILRDTAQARGQAYDTDLSAKYNTGYGWGMVDAYGAVKRAEELSTGGTIVGPPSIAAGSSGSFTARFDLTRTEWETTNTNVTFNISVPREWGKPSSIAVSSDEGVAYTTGNTDPVQGISNWTFSAWASFSSAVSAPKVVKPKVTFTTFAPIELATYDFFVTPNINGVEGSEDDFAVQVTEGTGGLPDFYLSQSDISFSTDTPVAGQFVTVNAVIHNGGTLGSNANVTFHDGPPETGLIIGVDTVSVPSGGMDTATTAWLATPGTHTIHVVVDLLDAVEETSEDNNRANKSIYVGGMNNPPTASLTVSPTNVGVGFPVFFDGSNSTDIDGTVVLYNFNFGDGNSSGWIPSPNITYFYSGQGLYFASLTVQDNGGTQSTNNPEVLVSVQPTTTKGRTLFIHEAYRLLFTEPDSDDPSTVGLPNGFTPIAPGSPFGTVEEEEIGIWTTNTFKKNNTIGGTVKYHIWVNNTGPQDIEVTNFTFYLEHNDVVIDQVVVSNTNFIRRDVPVEIVGYSSLSDREIGSDDLLALNIWCAIDGDGGVLEFASKDRGSGVDLTFTTFQGIPPIVDAGENITARVNETVEFIPSASDEDGQIDKYEWDFDDDGVWDYTSASNGVTSHVYMTEGEYSAMIRVTDNEGDTATDNLTVTIRPKNRAPTLSDPSPAGSISMDAGSTRTFSIKVTDPDGDPVTIKWYVDGRKQSSEGATFSYTPEEAAIGNHEIKLTASDGEASKSHTWTVSVKEVNHAPEIVDTTPSTQFLMMNEDETMQFSADVYDEDGDEITFRWTLDGLLVGSSTFYTFIADEDSVGRHEIKVTVSDGEFDISTNWTVDVLSLNNKPIIRFTMPNDGDRFYVDDQINFEVDAKDPDGDTITYTWTSSIDQQLGKQRSVTLSLSKGTHTITISISDGRGGEASKSFVITVSKRTTKDDTGDSVGAIILLVVVILVAVVLFFMFERRKRDMHARAAHRRRIYEEHAEVEEEVVKRPRPKKRTKKKKKRPRPRPTMMVHAVEEEEEELEDMFGFEDQEEEIIDEDEDLIDEEEEEFEEPKPRPRPKKVVKKVKKRAKKRVRRS